MWIWKKTKLKKKQKKQPKSIISKKLFGNKDDKVLSKFEFEGQTSEKPVWSRKKTIYKQKMAWKKMLSILLEVK